MDILTNPQSPKPLFQERCASGESKEKFQPLSQREPLLQENPERFVIFPIRLHEAWEYYQTHKSSLWMAEEIDIQGPLTDWEEITLPEKGVIKLLLGFLMLNDLGNNQTPTIGLMSEVQYPELRCFYGFQLAIENIHKEMYSLLFDNYLPDGNDQRTLFQDIQKSKTYRLRNKWLETWVVGSKSFAERMVGFALMKGLFFCGVGCVIFWLKERGWMPGLTTANQKIHHDRVLHCGFACFVYSLVKESLPESKVHKMLLEALDLEKALLATLELDLLGISEHLMMQYTEVVADEILDALGYAKLLKSSNPFNWMSIPNFKQTLKTSGSASKGEYHQRRPTPNSTYFSTEAYF